MAYPHIETKTDYALYQASVKFFMHQNKIEIATTESGDDAEPHFSWEPCGCCGRSLGGNRHKGLFVAKDGYKFSLDVCVDCMYYFEYGRLDDMTMQKIEESSNVG